MGGRRGDAGAHDDAGAANDARAVGDEGGIGTASEGGEGGPAAGHPATPHGPGTAAQGAIQVRVHQPAPGDPSPSRTTVGVGEEVHFTGHGDGNWSVIGGGGTGASGVGAEFDWTAPDAPGPVTISHARAGHDAEQIRMTVVAPDSIQFRKTRDEAQTPAGAGMWTNLTFHPLNVSFYRAEWLEVPTAAENVSGYFLAYQAAGHDISHSSAATEWLPMGAQNNGVDDHAFTSGKPRPWSAGDFEWNVPNKYRVAGQGDGTVFTHVVQHFHMEPNGQVTVSKGGQSATQTPSGVMAGAGADTIEPIPSVAAATNLITQDGFARSLRQLADYRARDQASYQNLLTALTQAAPAHYVYVGIKCLNSYSWVMSDSGTVSVSGNSRGHIEQISVDSGQFRELHVPFLSLFDLATFDSQAELSISPTIEGHEMHIAMSYPFATLGSWTALPGSDGRYQVRSFVHE
jgi:hypothetical protein